jgi:hypothetical protein
VDPLNQALRGAHHQFRPALQPLESVLIVGGGGVLGSALLAEALVAGRFQRVASVVALPLTSTVRGFEPWPQERLAAGQAPTCNLAFVVYERERHSNGRDEAFHAPEPGQLVATARSLCQAGVRRLIVVVPHAAALLPHALKGGFATEDETAVAALGFEHVVFVRTAQAGRAAAGGTWITGFANWWLSQLTWMVPQREQPVRAVRLAALMVVLARVLQSAAPATRVLPPDVLWDAAQSSDAGRVFDQWLSGPRQ